MPLRADFTEGAAFICEDVSRLEYKGGMFYLTDDLGAFSLTRAMRPETFVKCVTGAYGLVRAWQAEQAAITAVDRLNEKVVRLR